MPQKEAVKIPRQVVVYLLIFGIGILAFVLLGIYPHYRQMAALDHRMDALKAEIEAQRVLAPYYQKLLAVSRQKAPQVLPIPQAARLKPQEVKKIDAVFADMARRSNLKVGAITPNIDSFVSDQGMLQMTLVLTGHYNDFRRFLLQLVELPYLTHIEKMTMEAAASAMRLDMKIWLAQE